MTRSFSLLPLKGAYQTYAWGEELNSSVLSHFKKTHPELPSGQPIAELWFGSHKNGEAKVLFNNKWQSLTDFWKETDNISNLNFLSKILCIKKPLSIQIHPDKNQAIELHKESPLIFPDKNPKPEMAVALSPLRLLCGTKKIGDIKKIINNTPAFKKLEKFTTLLELDDQKILFKEILTLSQSEVENFVESVMKSDSFSVHDDLIKNMLGDLSCLDPGVIAQYFLEYIEVEKGQVIYIKPNIPHAYLSGNAFECMQNSDNVVRGGITPKPIDVNNFCRLVDINPYNPFMASERVTTQIERYTNEDLPFKVDFINLINEESSKIFLDNSEDHEILMVISGAGSVRLENQQLSLETGSCFYSARRGALEISGKKLSLFKISNKVSSLSSQ